MTNKLGNFQANITFSQNITFNIKILMMLQRDTVHSMHFYRVHTKEKAIGAWKCHFQGFLWDSFINLLKVIKPADCPNKRMLSMYFSGFLEEHTCILQDGGLSSTYAPHQHLQGTPMAFHFCQFSLPFGAFSWLFLFHPKQDNIYRTQVTTTMK